MKAIFASVCLLALASIPPAEAKGCIKGAIVGAPPATWLATASSALRRDVRSAITKPTSPTPTTRRAGPVGTEVADRTTHPEPGDAK